MADRLRATAALRELNKRYAGRARPIGYQRFWRQLAAGLIPSQRVDGHYEIEQRDLPRIAAALGLDVNQR